MRSASIAKQYESGDAALQGQKAAAFAVLAENSNFSLFVSLT
jgi:hypothetical protein